MHARRSPLFILLTALAALALATGCEIDNSGDDDTNDIADASDATDDTTPDDMEEDEVTPPDPYRFVRINDQSAKATTVNGGADIDAIVLEKAGTGEQVYATEVKGFAHGGGFAEGTELNPQDALDAPDSFSLWEDTEDPVCDIEGGYVSLGGMGGYLIVEMGADIETGDTLTVLEVGGCTGNSGEAGIKESVQVQISVASEIDAQWTTLGSLEGPVATFDVPEL